MVPDGVIQQIDLAIENRWLAPKPIELHPISLTIFPDGPAWEIIFPLDNGVYTENATDRALSQIFKVMEYSCETFLLLNCY